MLKLFKITSEILKVNDADNVITLNKEVKRVPIIFSWENLTVQTLCKPKKSIPRKKIINNGKIKLFLIFYLHSNNCNL